MRNRKIPVEILKLGAQDPDAGVRAIAMDNPKIPDDILCYGKSDPDEDVRMAVMQHIALRYESILRERG
jgi:hypothetical protein